MTETPEQLRTLVRRDLAVLIGGGAIAIWLCGLLVAGKLGLLSEDTSSTIVVAAASVVCLGCLGWWAAGPRRWLRDRYLVLVPVCLAGPTAAIALYDLGASVFAVVISSALGFCIAIVAGLTWANRRSD